MLLPCFAPMERSSSFLKMSCFPSAKGAVHVTVGLVDQVEVEALYRCFKEVTALSPLQYQKRLRLQEARRLMLGKHVDAAEASFRVGYERDRKSTRLNSS